MSGSLIQIENRKTLWTVSTPACVSWVCVGGSSARKPGSQDLPVDSAVRGVKRVNFWDTEILQLTRNRMSLSKIFAHLRQSWYILGDNNYYNVNSNNNNNNSIKHLSRLFLSHGSQEIACIVLDNFGALWSPLVLSCAAMRESVSASLVLLCVRLNSVFVSVSVSVWSESGYSFMGNRRWFSLRGGSGPQGRRSRCCRRFPWQSSVVPMLHASLPSTVSWLLAAACPQPSPRSGPSPPTAWA